MIAAILVFLASQLSQYAASQTTQDYFSADGIFEFAQHLYQQDDYLRAAGEFQRYLFLTPRFSDRDSVFFRIGMCYRLSGDPAAAINYFGRIAGAGEEGIWRDRARCQLAYSYFQLRQFNESLLHTRRFPWHIASCSLDTTSMTIINYLHLREWRKAYQLTSGCHDSLHSSTVSLTTTLNLLALEGTRLPYKKQTAAAIMSLAVPGTGKIYAHRLSDGLYSMLTIGLTGWQALEGFSSDGSRSTKGWVFGTICGGLWLGNVYGSAVAVRIYNDALEERLLQEVGAAINAHLD